jgi:3-oxoadipate enol-lactonase
MWDGVANALKERYTVFRYDHRNHGRSEKINEIVSIDDMADDVQAVISAMRLTKVTFVGLSLGGMVAQSLAARYLDHIERIVVANSSSFYGPALRSVWDARIEKVLSEGTAAIVETTVARWFTPDFGKNPSGEGRKTVQVSKMTLARNEPYAYAAICDAVAGVDNRRSNLKIRCPSLVIAGSQDLATPVEMSKRLADEIPGAELIEIDAAHMSALEKPKIFADALEAWFSTN